MITVYGKKGCERCKKFKEKLMLLDVPYVEVDLEDSACCAREPNAAEAMAEYQLRESLPIVLIDGKWFEYADAIAELKGKV